MAKTSYRYLQRLLRSSKYRREIPEWLLYRLKKLQTNFNYYYFSEYLSVCTVKLKGQTLTPSELVGEDNAVFLELTDYALMGYRAYECRWKMYKGPRKADASCSTPIYFSSFYGDCLPIYGTEEYWE